MSKLILLRHAQASFGQADYDNLSPLGHQQAAQVGAYWAQRGQRFDAVYRGSLRRHQQTLAGLAPALGLDAAAAHERVGLNEYDSHALIATVHPEPLSAPRNADEYRNHFRLLKDGLAAWMSGSAHPVGMPSYRQFVDGIAAVLDEIRQQHMDQTVLLVSSGGPISTAVGHILGTPATTTVELNLRMRNTAITEFAFTPKRHMLVTYNTLPHLDSVEHAKWVTHA